MSNTPLPEQPAPQRFQVQPLISDALLGQYTADLEATLRQAATLSQRHRLPFAVWRHAKDLQTGRTIRAELVQVVEHMAKARSA